MYTEVVQKRKAKVAKESSSRSSKSRLDRIESLLDKVLRRLGDERLGDAADVILRHNGSEFVSRRTSPQSDSESDNESSENSEDEPRNTVKNESTSFIYPFKAPSSAQRGDTFSHTMERCQDRAFGGSSVFAVFSPSGLQWLSDRAGSPGIKQHMLGVFTKVFSKMHLRLRDFVEPIPEPLQPELSEAYVEALTNHFFDAVNYISGILDREDWNQIVAAYFDKPGSRPNGYAELYLFWTLILITTDFLHSVVDDYKEAPCFTKESIVSLRKAALANSIFYYTRIMSLGGSFHALQGTLLLAMYFFSTPMPHGVHLAVNTAARLAIDLGLHRREGYTHLPPKVARLRMRNWWLVYTLDRDLSLRSGIPPVIHDNDVSTPSPDSCDVGDDEGIDYIKWGDGHKTSYAQLLHGLSRISSKVYSQLYSASAARKSPEKLSECILKLDRELTQWRECLPAHLRPGTDVMVFDCSKGYADVHEADNSMRSQIVEWHSQFNSLWVHFNYYFLQSAIHRTSVYHPTWYNRKILGKGEKTGTTPNGGTPMSASSHEDNNGKGSPNPRLFSSHSICVQAARNTIYLTRNIPVKLLSCFWSFAFFLLSAFTILLIHVLQRPLEATIRADLELMKIAIDFLKSLPDGEEFNFLYVFTEFYDVAVKFVDTAQDRHRRQEAGEKLDPNTALDKLVYSTPTSMPQSISSTSQPQVSQHQQQQRQQHPQQQQQHQQQHQTSQTPQQHPTPSTVDSTYNMMVNDFYPQQQPAGGQPNFAPVDYSQGQPEVMPEMYSRPGNEWYFDMYQSGFMDYGNYNYEG